MALARAALPLCSFPNLVRRFRGKWGNRPDRGPSGINEKNITTESSVPLQLKVRPPLTACRVLLCASQDMGHAELGVLLAVVGREAERRWWTSLSQWLVRAAWPLLAFWTFPGWLALL